MSTTVRAPQLAILTHPLTFSFAHPFHSLTRSLAHPLTLSFAHSLACSLVHSPETQRTAGPSTGERERREGREGHGGVQERLGLVARLLAPELAAAAAATNPHPIPAAEPARLDSAHLDLRLVVVVGELQYRPARGVADVLQAAQLRAT